MPSVKANSSVTLIGQIRLISTAIDEASGVLAELVEHTKALDSLRQQLLNVLSDRSAQVNQVLGEAALQKAQPQMLTKMRAIEKSTTATLLKLQSNLQRESQVTTTVSNILKSKHDMIKSSIGNIA